MVNDAVIKSIKFLPDQIKTTFDLGLNLKLPEDYRQVQNIVITAMGGSRFPQFIIQELFKEEIKAPLLLNNEYRIPAFVNEKTLWIASSYSGTTEEAILGTKAACERGAKVVGVASGAELVEFLKEKQLPMIAFSTQFNPTGEPRMGWGYNMGATMGILLNLGLMDKSLQQQIENAIEKLRALNQDTIAQELTQKLVNSYPSFIVAEFLNGCGNALANEVNETAKNFAEFRIIPELNHHLMEGLKNPKAMKEISKFVFFFSKLYSPAIQKRFLITREVVEQNGIEAIWHEARGEDKVSQVLEMLQLGSLLSMYLSEAYGENPTAIPFVDYFKKRLKEA
jgi:glucose/mannose-6-phosphate isomerase